jgi:hypothetical protein
MPNGKWAVQDRRCVRRVGHTGGDEGVQTGAGVAAGMAM